MMEGESEQREARCIMKGNPVLFLGCEEMEVWRGHKAEPVFQGLECSALWEQHQETVQAFVKIGIPLRFQELEP